MHKVFISMAVSLDGYIAADDGDLAWINDAMSPDEDYGFAEIAARTGAVVMGTTSYEEMLKTGFAAHETAPLFVVTHRTDLKKQREDVRFYSGDLGKLIADTKSKTDKDIYVYGGGDVISQCLAADVVDEISLAIVPVLLGSGTTLFKQTKHGKHLKLVSNKKFKSGMVILNYTFNTH